MLAVINLLRGRRSMLVIDNCEQVVGGCVESLSAMRSAGVMGLVIASSRIPLGLADETVYTLPPMTDDALALFADRAER